MVRPRPWGGAPGQDRRRGPRVVCGAARRPASVVVVVGRGHRSSAVVRIIGPPRQGGGALRDVSHTLAVYSCKGGVGKSTVAVNLAYRLSAMGDRVGLVYLDVYGPSLPLLVWPDNPAVRGSHPGAGLRPNAVEPIMHRSVGLMSLGYICGGVDAEFACVCRRREGRLDVARGGGGTTPSGGRATIAHCLRCPTTSQAHRDSSTSLCRLPSTTRTSPAHRSAATGGGAPPRLRLRHSMTMEVMRGSPGSSSSRRRRRRASADDRQSSSSNSPPQRCEAPHARPRRDDGARQPTIANPRRRIPPPRLDLVGAPHCGRPRQLVSAPPPPP